MIRVMCSGRVDLAFVIAAFAKGQDGVYIGGCRLNECNYSTHGNYAALNMVLLCQQIMAHIGLNPARLRVEFLSSGEGNRFTESVDEFTETVKALGPLGTGAGESVNPDELPMILSKIEKLVPYIKVALKEKLSRRPESPEAYDTFFGPEEIRDLLDNTVSYYIDPQKCRACMNCLRRCPADAVIGAKKQIHIIDQEKCIKCGTCFEVCPDRFNAVQKITGLPVPPPISEDERAIAASR